MKPLSAASAIPRAIIQNDVLEARLGLEPGWIERRTGILQRPAACADEATSDFAIRAGQAALEKAAIDPRDIGMLLLATSTPDHVLPPTAPLVAYRLGLTNAGAIDLAGACAGFIYALVLAASYGPTINKPVLVIGANVLSRRVNENDAATAALFSDGAGAVVLAPCEHSHILGSFLTADGSSYEEIGVPAGGSRQPLTAAGLSAGLQFMTMRRGPSLFKKAVAAMAAAGKEAMRRAQVDASGIDWWIPHQANLRLIRDSGNALQIPSDRTICTVDQYGNSSAATIPIALAHALEAGKIQQGQVLLLTAVGAGVLSAGVVLRW